MTIHSEKYTITCGEYGVVIYGSVPVSDLAELLEFFRKKGWSLLDPAIASYYGATIVVTSPQKQQLWHDAILASENSTGTSIEDRCQKWLQGLDTGASSRTICAGITGNLGYLSSLGPDVPYDGDDVGRCVRLLNLIPEWRSQLTKVASKYPRWTAWVARWGEVEAAYTELLKDPKNGTLGKALYTLCGTLNGHTKSA